MGMLKKPFKPKAGFFSTTTQADQVTGFRDVVKCDFKQPGFFDCVDKAESFCPKEALHCKQIIDMRRQVGVEHINKKWHMTQNLAQKKVNICAENTGGTADAKCLSEAKKLCTIPYNQEPAAQKKCEDGIT